MPIDIFDDVSAPESPAPAPVVPVAPQKPVDAGSGSMASWIASALLLCLCVLVGLLLYRPADGDGDDIKPPAVSGLHVLLIEESGDRDKLTRDQAAIFTSIPLRDWLKANCAQEGGQPAYRKYDKDDNLENETPVWRDLRQLVTEPPLVVIARDGKRAIQFKPESPQAMQEKLAAFKAGKK